MTMKWQLSAVMVSRHAQLRRQTATRSCRKIYNSSIPVDSFLVEGGGVCRLGLLHRRGGDCCGGLGIGIGLLVALLKGWPLDGITLLQPDLSLALQQLMLACRWVHLECSCTTMYFHHTSIVCQRIMLHPTVLA